MIDQLRKILNEDQDPKAIEKISGKLQNLIMHNEEVVYIGVQKKPAINVFPDSIVMTNKRIIICKPKNLGLSMSFQDYDWEEIYAPFVKENILGAEFSFMTKKEEGIKMDYLPKNQARKLFTFAKEQLDDRKNLLTRSIDHLADSIPYTEVIEEVETEEVDDFNELKPVQTQLPEVTQPIEPEPTLEEIIGNSSAEIENTKELKDLSKEELFEKLLNYKKLLDHGLILQSEYDRLKEEVIKFL